MNVYFVDTSALAKRYLRETGSDWVIQWIAPSTGNIIIVSELVLAEMFTLLNRRLRENAITKEAYTVLAGNFLVHYRDDYLSVSLDRSILQSVRSLAERYPIRALDAIQLASAIRAQQLLDATVTFVSGDKNLLNAAIGEGLVTDDPNIHLSI